MHEYIGYIVSALATGSLTWLATIKSTKKQAEADAMAKVQDVYQELVDDLKRDRDEMKATIRHLQERITELDQACRENARKVEQMRPMICSNMACTSRINNKDL